MAVDIQAQVVSFTWMPPSITNGVITNYTLTYFNTTDNLSITIEANMLGVNVESLNEFTSYSFELRAATRIGAGEPATVNLTTAQAGTYDIVHIAYVSIKKNCIIFCMCVCYTRDHSL